MTRLIWSPQSLGDIESIRDFISKDSPLYADLVVRRLTASVERLTAFPLSGRVVPELQREDIREVIHPPFRVVYRISADLIEVVTVFRSSRLLPRLSE